MGTYGGPMGSSNPFDAFLQQNAPPGLIGMEATDEDRIAYAQQKFPGGRLGQDQYGRPAWMTGRTTIPLSSFTPPEFKGPQLPSLGLAALGHDVGRMQGAADRQFERNQAQIGAVDDFLGQAPDAILQGGQQNTADLDDLTQRMGNLAQTQPDQFQQLMQSIQGGMDAGVQGIQDIAGQAAGGFDRAQGVAEQAIGNLGNVSDRIDKGVAAMEMAAEKFADSIKDYRNFAVQDAAATAAGIRRAGHNAMKMVQAGVRPDGTPMTAEEQQDARIQVMAQTNNQVQEAITPIFSQYNAVNAQLHQSLAQMEQAIGGAQLQGAALERDAIMTALQGSTIMGQLEQGKLAAGDLAMSGLALRAQVSTALSGQFLQSQEGQRVALQAAASTAQSAAAIRQAAILDSANLQMQGLFGRASLVQQNPESVISYFQGLLALYNLTSAQAGRAVVA